MQTRLENQDQDLGRQTGSFFTKECVGEKRGFSKMNLKVRDRSTSENSESDIEVEVKVQKKRENKKVNTLASIKKEPKSTPPVKKAPAAYGTSGASNGRFAGKGPMVKKEQCAEEDDKKVGDDQMMAEHVGTGGITCSM